MSKEHIEEIASKFFARIWEKLALGPETLRNLCEELHISPKFYDLEFASKKMSFRKDTQEVSSAKALMGKNMIVTDNCHWSTEEIVLASLDRYKSENQFKVSKDPFQVQVNPMFHWTDGKIRCHLLTCMMAMTALKLF